MSLYSVANVTNSFYMSDPLTALSLESSVPQMSKTDHCNSACLCRGQQQCSFCHVRRAHPLVRGIRHFPFMLQTLTPIAFPLPVQDLWSVLIISLHQIYPQPRLCILVKLVWANAAHQPLMYMPAPHLKDLGLADALKSKKFV